VGEEQAAVIPTLRGRLQTRIFLIVVVGGIWTAFIGLWIPGVPEGVARSDVYELLYKILLAVLVLGILWECVYHGLQQFRWEKDWPTFFGFLEGITEGLLLWILLEAELVPWIDGEVPGTPFLWHFATTWIVCWAFGNGPMKVVFIRWRLQGGRLVGP
jgi:hypothetical protein